MPLSISYNGTDYELQISATGVVQIKTGTGSFVDSPMTGVSAARFSMPWILAVIGDGTHRKMDASDTSAFFSSVNEPSISGEYQNAVSLNASVVPVLGTTPTPPPSGGAQAHVIASDIDLTGHKVTKMAAGTAFDDGVRVDQLTAAQFALTQAIEAGDLANADAIALTNVRIDNLPAGVTMAMVTAEAQRLVGIAVANEITEDAQVQAIVDALITSLQNVDASILTNVSALQAQMVDLIPRVVALEAAKVAQDAVNASQAQTNASQATTNSAVQNALNTNAAAIGVEAATNAAQNLTLTSHAGQISAINLRLDPIVYKIRGGVCTEAINAMASQCVQSGIAGPDASYAVTLPAGRAHSVGVVYLMMGGKRVQVACGATVDAAGLVNQFSFLNVDADIVFS